MLTEITHVRQNPDEGYRRWLTDRRFDLIIWYSERSTEIRQILGFQLCYNKTEIERAIRWRKASGFVHEIVDGGEYPGHANMTPVLHIGGQFDQAVLDDFREVCGDIERDLAEFIMDKLVELKTDQSMP